MENLAPAAAQYSHPVPALLTQNKCLIPLVAKNLVRKLFFNEFQFLQCDDIRLPFAQPMDYER